MWTRIMWTEWPDCLKACSWRQKIYEVKGKCVMEVLVSPLETPNIRKLWIIYRGASIKGTVLTNIVDDISVLLKWTLKKLPWGHFLLSCMWFPTHHQWIVFAGCVGSFSRLWVLQFNHILGVHVWKQQSERGMGLWYCRTVERTCFGNFDSNLGEGWTVVIECLFGLLYLFPYKDRDEDGNNVAV